MKKLNIAIIAGGKSTEHQVSLISAKNIAAALDRQKFNLVLIGVDYRGRWFHFSDEKKWLTSPDDAKKVALNKKTGQEIFLSFDGSGGLKLVKNGKKVAQADVFFPIIHGTFGEDGTLQGVFKSASVPFVGAGVLGSALGMDKAMAKIVLKAAGIPVGKFLICRQNDKINFNQVVKILGKPIFIKPANGGSSVGIQKVFNEQEFQIAKRDAFRYDEKIILEEFLAGREIECAVLGNEKPKATVPGEIKPRHEFYSYEAKYLDDDGAEIIVPGKLSKKEAKIAQKLAVKTYQVLEAKGLARVDMFLLKNGKIFISEINTLPGFTSISMYPKLWQFSGLSYKNLITKLIELAQEKFAKENKLKIKYQP